MMIEDNELETKTKVINIGQTWKGFEKVDNLVIFGDSYSSVGYDSSQPPPTAPHNPLGVTFPGDTWTEGPDTPNWVGWLLSKYCDNHKLVAYDYAVGGNEISGVHRQMHYEFLPDAGDKRDQACHWEESDTLFVTWIGINDCAFAFEKSSVVKLVDNLFGLQDDLYKAGARNFLFIDLPPIHRSPAGQRDADDGVPYTTWNEVLLIKVKEFAASHPGTTNLVFSAWDTFTRVLERPTSYGLGNEDVSKPGGGIWSDHLHPTSKMHDILASDMSAFLHSVPAFS